VGCPCEESQSRLAALNPRWCTRPQVEYLLNTGNLVSNNSLDLSQATGFTVVAEKLNFFRCALPPCPPRIAHPATCTRRVPQHACNGPSSLPCGEWFWPSTSRTSQACPEALRHVCALMRHGCALLRHACALLTQHAHC
jgi:hypothetical protein